MSPSLAELDRRTRAALAEASVMRRPLRSHPANGDDERAPARGAASSPPERGAALLRPTHELRPRSRTTQGGEQETTMIRKRKEVMP